MSKVTDLSEWMRNKNTVKDVHDVLHEYSVPPAHLTVDMHSKLDYIAESARVGWMRDQDLRAQDALYMVAVARSVLAHVHLPIRQLNCAAVRQTADEDKDLSLYMFSADIEHFRVAEGDPGNMRRDMEIALTVMGEEYLTPPVGRRFDPAHTWAVDYIPAEGSSLLRQHAITMACNLGDVVAANGGFLELTEDGELLAGIPHAINKMLLIALTFDQPLTLNAHFADGGDA